MNVLFKSLTGITNSKTTKEEFIKINKDVFKGVFKGVGKFDQKCIIKLKDGVIPIIKSGRRLSLTIKEKLRETLTEKVKE